MELATINISPQEKEILKKAIGNPIASIRSLVKNDLYFFLQYFWDTYSQDEFSPNWHIKYICKELELVARRVAIKEPRPYDLIINVPPGTTKTGIVSIMFPLWCWVNWHWMRFITASYSAPLSLESAEYSRDVLRSEKFQEIFPELDIKQDKDTKSNFRIVKKQIIQSESKGIYEREDKGGNRFSTSVKGSLTGFHGHINIIDDPLDPMRAVSEVEVKKANHWMDNVLPFRKVDKKVTPTILIMQRLHQNDPTGHLLKIARDEIKHICIPGEIKNYRHKVSPPELVDKYKDDLLDPVRLDWDVLNGILKRGQFTYGGQVGQDPIPLGGGMFKTDHITVIDRMPDIMHIESVVRYWDKAGTKGGGAFTVGVKMCKLKDGTFIVPDVKRGQWSSEERERIIKETARADNLELSKDNNLRKRCAIYIEQEPGSGGKESAQATVKNLAGFSVHRDLPTGDKVYRADPYSVQVNEGNVSILHGKWNEDYIDEIQNFPNSTYKDQTDASSGAFSKLIGLKKVKVMVR